MLRGRGGGRQRVTNRQLLEWVASTLHLRLPRLNDAFASHIYCQLFDIIHANKVPLHKVRWPARSEPEHIDNLRVLQFTFAQLGESKRIDIEVLVKNKFQDNLQFLHWLHDQWVAAGCPQPTQDPTQRRMRCKGMRKAKRRRRRGHRSPDAAGRQRRSVLPPAVASTPPRAAAAHESNSALAQAPSFRLPSRSGSASAAVAPVDFAAAALQSPTRVQVAPARDSPTSPIRSVGVAEGDEEFVPARSASTSARGGGGAPSATPTSRASSKRVPPSSIEKSLFAASLFHFHPPVRPRGAQHAYAQELQALGMDSLAQELRSHGGGGTDGDDGAASSAGDTQSDADDMWGELDDLQIEVGDDITAIPLATARPGATDSDTLRGIGTKRASFRIGAHGRHLQAPPAKRKGSHPALARVAEEDESDDGGGGGDAAGSMEDDKWAKSENEVKASLVSLDERLERLRKSRAERAARRSTRSSSSASQPMTTSRSARQSRDGPRGVGSDTAASKAARQKSHSSDGIATTARTRHRQQNQPQHQHRHSHVQRVSNAPDALDALEAPAWGRRAPAAGQPPAPPAGKTGRAGGYPAAGSAAGGGYPAAGGAGNGYPSARGAVGGYPTAGGAGNGYPTAGGVGGGYPGGAGGGYPTAGGVGGGYPTARGAGGGYPAAGGVGGGYPTTGGVGGGYPTARGAGGGYPAAGGAGGYPTAGGAVGVGAAAAVPGLGIGTQGRGVNGGRGRGRGGMRVMIPGAARPGMPAGPPTAAFTPASAAALSARPPRRFFPDTMQNPAAAAYGAPSVPAAYHGAPPPPAFQPAAMPPPAAVSSFQPAYRR